MRPLPAWRILLTTWLVTLIFNIRITNQGWIDFNPYSHLMISIMAGSFLALLFGQLFIKQIKQFYILVILLIIIPVGYLLTNTYKFLALSTNYGSFVSTFFIIIIFGDVIIRFWTQKKDISREFIRNPKYFGIDLINKTGTDLFTNYEFGLKNVSKIESARRIFTPILPISIRILLRGADDSVVSLVIGGCMIIIGILLNGYILQYFFIIYEIQKFEKNRKVIFLRNRKDSL